MQPAQIGGLTAGNSPVQSPSRNWVNIIALLLFHAGALAALFLFTWQALWTGLALLWISGGWGIGMGYHRLLTHRGYRTPRWLERTLAICGTLAMQGGPLFWVATHRLHHRNSDKSGDPHSPRDGWWWSHAGWLVRGDPMRDTALARYVPDLRRDPFYCWLDQWHVVPLLALAVILAAWGTIQEGAHLAASLVCWGIFLRTTVELHGTWLVNSAAHTWGRRRFETPDDSTNNWWVALVTFGEGWHNNHHAFPRSVRHGLAWYELDINWLCIRALHRAGLARNLSLARIGDDAGIRKAGNSAARIMRVSLLLLFLILPTAARDPFVQIRNTGHLTSREFQIGDRFEILITGPPNQPISVRTIRQGSTDWSAIIGSTDRPEE